MSTAAAGSIPSARNTTPATAGMARSNAILSAAVGTVGLLSYGCTLLMAHLLPTRDYTAYSAAAALLTSVGVAASALVPLPLSQVIRAHSVGSPRRREGMAFAYLVSLLAGVAAGVVLVGVAALFTTTSAALMVGAAAFALFVIMPTWGWLQGELRFGWYAGTSVVEVGIRLSLSVIAAALGWGVGGVVAGFVAGAAVVAGVGLWFSRRDLAWNPRVLTERSRWSETGGIAMVQLVLSTLVGADVVVLVLIGDPASPAVAGYQAIATLTKAPIYVAAGTVLISFPLLRTATSCQAAGIIRQSVRSYLALALTAAAVLGTVPTALAELVLPSAYLPALPVLPWLAVAGLGYGTTTVLAVILLALRAYTRSLLGLLAAAAALSGGLLVGWQVAGANGLAVGAALGSLTAAGVLIAVARPLLPGGITGPAVRAITVAALFAAALLGVRAVPGLWIAAVVVGGLVMLYLTQQQPSRHAATDVNRDTPSLQPRRLRVLHLGFEDPAAPGAGGGPLRTHQINRRLTAAGHTITVLTTRFPGCSDRVQDGVRYIHVGVGTGRTRIGRLLGYVIRLPTAARRHAADLVVEDFFAPISTIATPLWTGRPTIGVVQWLNARDKARQYKVPVHLIERFGVRRHHHLIAVSDGIAQRLRAMNPKVQVDVIANGVDPAAFITTPRVGDNIVFLGRLETAQKGLDLLLQAWATASRDTPGQLLIAGTGPDEQRLRSLVTDLGIAERVQFLGWVTGADKYELLASARLAVLPSRFETFGIVAIEALATGTPIVAFDIPCLREVVPAGCGALVPAFDVAGYAAAITDLYADPQRIAAAVPRGRAFAARYDWDALALRQEQVYTAAASVKSSPPAGHHSASGSAAADSLDEQLATLGRRRAGRDRPRRIVALGNVGNGNTGDEALMTVAIQKLGDDTEITLLSRNPDRAAATHHVAARPLTARGALGALLHCDGLVIVGGGMFGPGLPPLVRWLPWVAEICRRLGRAVAYLGVGIYPGTPAPVLAALRKAATRGQMTVRDQLTVRTLNIPHPVTHVGDLARHLEPAPAAQANRALKDAGVDTSRPLLLLAPKASTTPEQTAQLLQWLSLAAARWNAAGGTVASIAFSDRADYGIREDNSDALLAARIARHAGFPIPLVGPNLPPQLAAAVIAQAEAVLGLRYHALVFALSTGVPSMGPAWEPKSRALIDEHHLSTLSDTNALESWIDSLTPARSTSAFPR